MASEVDPVERSDELHRILAANLPDTTVFLLDHDLRILIADGEAIRRLPWFDEALFRGRLVAELDGMVPDEVLELSLSTYRAALAGRARRLRVPQRGADVLRPGGARAR